MLPFAAAIASVAAAVIVAVVVVDAQVTSTPTPTPTPTPTLPPDWPPTPTLPPDWEPTLPPDWEPTPPPDWDWDLSSCYRNLSLPFPMGLDGMCDLGYYCPNITVGQNRTYPKYCSPTLECQLLRLASEFCDEQGEYEPLPCKQGMLCRNYTTMEPCPEGHFCPVASYEPKPCHMFSYCPEGSGSQLYYGGVVIVAIIDSLLVALYMLLRYRDNMRQRMITESTEVGSVSSERTPLFNKIADDAVELQDPTPILASSFEYASRGLKIDLTFANLGLTLPSGKVILSGVSGNIHSGRATAVMGPSGAGKTTFINVLLDKVARTSGQLLINGNVDEMFHYKKVLGYVPQEDIMLRELTVRENIAFSARVRLPRSWPAKQVEEHIDAVIDALGLYEVQHVLIGDSTERGISGGQRKRVNIGMELVSCPIVLVLDEPTSGLDATAALQVCRILKSISNLGLTVVSVIHQPRVEIFESFDDVLMIAPGGRTAYIGPTSNVVPYFESLGYEFPLRNNPADVLMDIIAGKRFTATQQVTMPRNPSSRTQLVTAADLVRSWEEHHMKSIKGLRNGGEFDPSLNDPSVYDPLNSTSSKREIQGLVKERGALFFFQLYLCFTRALLQQYRRSLSFLLEIFVGCLAGLLMGLASMLLAGNLYQGVLRFPYTFISPSPILIILPQIALLVAMAVGIAGAPAGVLTFGEEKLVYWREASNGHNRVAYYLGKTFSTIPRFTMSSLHFAALFYLLCATVIPFDKLYLIILMLFYNVYGLAAVVSIILPRELSSLVAVIGALIYATLCGYGPTLTNAKDWHVEIFWYLSYALWGAEALYSEETTPFAHFYEIEESASFFGYSLYRYGMDIGMMFLLGTVARITGFFLLITLNRQFQK